ncbi:MAG: thioredoxin family protein [Anaerolineae bacterium]|nr:thioredoxin family protein [Anaerolineae bacterium]
MIHVKILGNKSHLRYPVRRLVESARASLRTEYPDLQLDIQEVSDMEEILRYTPVMMAPGLVIGERLVYDLWIPKKEQVVEWLKEAIREQSFRSGHSGS